MLKFISWISSFTAIFITCVAFILSYSALLGTVQDYSTFSPTLSYLWPLLLDALLAVSALAVIRASLFGGSTYYARTLVALTTALSITFNVLHSNTDSIISIIIHGFVPIAFFLSFELVMSQLRQAVLKSELLQSMKKLTEQKEKLTQEIEKLTQERKDLTPSKETSLVLYNKELTREERFQSFETFINETEEDFSVAQLAEKFGVSKPTIYSWQRKVDIKVSIEE